MIRRPPRFTRTHPLSPYTTLCRAPRADRDDQPGDDDDECDHQTLLRVRVVLRAAALTVAPCGRRGRDFLTSGRRSVGAPESVVIAGCCDASDQGQIGRAHV